MNESKYKAQRNLRDMIDGELNRIAVTDSEDEIKTMVYGLILNISEYSKMHLSRVRSYSPYNPYNENEKENV